tara:strand:- start:197 stop:391 length:195 start_codon:yes stop_codon:yes gene_type:complete
MRQGGFVPKNHDSGVYWVRANANTSSKKEERGEAIEEMFPVPRWWTGFSIVTSIIIVLLIAGNI